MPKPIKVLLIVPPVSRTKIYGKFAKVGAQQPPLGLLYLASSLRKHGTEVFFFDGALAGRGIEDVLQYVKQVEPDLVGMTVVTFTAPTALMTAKAIKALRPQTKIVVGGAHISAMPEEMLACDEIDFGIAGEGEHALTQLAMNLEAHEVQKTIPGLYFKTFDGVISSGGPPAMINDLDSLPFPAIDLLGSLDQYKPKAIMYRRKPVFAIFTSRGCPFRCIFCNSSRERVVRYHSVERVLDEIRYLRRHYGVREILINDDTFTLKKKRVIEFCEEIMRLDTPPEWVCNIQISTVDKEMLSYMKQAGCWLIMPGVESGNPSILKTIRKKITIEQVRQVCEWARELKLWVKPSFIIGHPNETLATIDDTIMLAKSIYSHYPSFALMTPFPGTELWAMADTYGKFDSSDYEALSPTADHPPFIPHGLTAEQLTQKQKEAFKACYFNPAMVFRHLYNMRSMSDIKRNLAGFMTLFKM